VAWKAVAIIHEGINQIELIVANTMLNLCHSGLQQVKEDAYFKVALKEDKIIYHEKGHVVGDAGPSTSIPS